MALFGSGWTWLVEDQNHQLRIMTSTFGRTPISMGFVPVLALDCWEHAYHPDFGFDKKVFFPFLQLLFPGPVFFMSQQPKSAHAPHPSCKIYLAYAHPLGGLARARPTPSHVTEALVRQHAHRHRSAHAHNFRTPSAHLYRMDVLCGLEFEFADATPHVCIAARTHAL